jgi:patatin-like phospholipase/acyl hydrolase
MACFIGFLLKVAIIPGFNYVFVKSQPNSVLEKALEFLPNDVTLENAITEDFMTISWNLNARDPYLLTKKSIAADFGKQDLAAYNNLRTAAFLSAVNPLYFLPYQNLEDAKNKDKVFISGNSASESPAMWAYMFAT